MFINDNATNTSAIVEMLALGASVTTTLLVLGWMLWCSHYGFDFTDESYYLVWMSNPFNYSVSVSQFGFVYHPLYIFLDGNIAALRQANILITFGLAWILSDIFLKSVYGGEFLQRAPRLIISAGIATTATASLVFAGMWLPTPGYNSLAFQSLLVAVSGLILADKHATRVSVIGWILIGIGGSLAFMAKPTTAAALGFCTVFYLLLASKFRARLLSISVTTAIGIVILAAVAIDESVVAFLDRLKGGLEVGRELGSGHTLDKLFQLDAFQVGKKAKIAFLSATATIVFLFYLSRKKIWESVQFLPLLLVGFILIIFIIVLGFVQKTINGGQFQSILLWLVPLAVILARLPVFRIGENYRAPRSKWALAFTLLMLPYAYAFGTNNSYWSLMAGAGIFCVLAGLIFLRPIGAGRKPYYLLLTIGLVVQMITMALVYAATDTPYRQPQPLHQNDYKIAIGKSRSELVLSQGFGHYITDAINLANLSQFMKGTPMIDLSGRSPGILYALGANSIGQAWTMGGYPGSDKLAMDMLKKVSCEQLSRAWLLTEPDSTMKISSEILASFGANMKTDFALVGTIKSAEGAGGHKEIRVQQLLKPIRRIDVAMAACAANRMYKQ